MVTVYVFKCRRSEQIIFHFGEMDDSEAFIVGSCPGKGVFNLPPEEAIEFLQELVKDSLKVQVQESDLEELRRIVTNMRNQYLTELNELDAEILRLSKVLRLAD